MVHKLIILLCLSVTGCAGSFENFSQRDYQYQVSGTAITVADWNQTLQFEKDGRNEQNTFMGDHPSKDRINTLIPLAIAGQWLGAWALPVEANIFGIQFNPRRVFQIGVIAGESWAVHHNYKAGINIEF